jgi:hypothetical protein
LSFLEKFIERVILNKELEKQQKEICIKYNAVYFEAPFHLKVGVSKNFKSGLLPINGLRHFPGKSTTGWYFWAGEEIFKDDDFFEPMHVAHFIEFYPNFSKYLGLPPGWRFLVAGDYEDIWQDQSLLRDG